MDSERFDSLAKILGASADRKGFLKLLGGVAASGLMALNVGDAADARKGKKRGKKRGKRHSGGGVGANGGSPPLLLCPGEGAAPTCSTDECDADSECTDVGCACNIASGASSGTCGVPALGLTYLTPCRTPQVNQWRVRNCHTVDIPFTFDIVGTTDGGQGIAAAAVGGVCTDTVFTTDTGNMTVVLKVCGVQVNVKAGGAVDEGCNPEGSAPFCCLDDFCHECCSSADCPEGEDCACPAGETCQDFICVETCPGSCSVSDECESVIGGPACVCFLGSGVDVAAVITEGPAPVGTCGECRGAGATCDASTECCGQLVCRDGSCARKPKPGRRCNKHGHACHGDNDCCAQGVCYNGRCGEKDTHCKSNGECAHGFTCVGGKQTGSHRRCRRKGHKPRNKRNRGRG